MKSRALPWCILVLTPTALASCSGRHNDTGPSDDGDVETVVNPGQAPTAQAGGAATCNGGEIFMLDGTGSTDPDGDPLRYTWRQTGGTNTVQLSDAHAARPVFEVPNADDVLTFSLTVNDGYDSSPPSTVTITAVAYTGTKVAPLTGSPFRGSLSFADAGEDLVIAGNYVYLPARTHGLRVVDGSDPVNLATAATLASPQGADAHDVARIGNFIYHTDYDATFDHAEIHITSVVDPTVPTYQGMVASFDAPTSAKITAVGSILYAAGGDDATTASLRVYEVTDVAHPLANTAFKISQVLPAPPEDVEVAGSYAYVADGASGLRIIDVGQATAGTPSISETGSYDTSGAALDVAVSGNYAYVADGMNGLVIVNASNPASPSLLATIPTSTGSFYGVLAVDVSGSTLYFADDFDVRIYDVSAPATPVEIGRYRAGNLIRKVRRSGSYLYVTDSQGLRTIPADTVSLPRGAPLYTAPDAVREMKGYGDLAFVRMDHRVDILDVRNAAAPSILSSYTPAGPAYLHGIAVVDNFAYLTESNDKLQLLRFRNAAAAALARTITVGEGAQDIVATDDFAYVYLNAFPNARIVIYDLASPYAPAARGALASPHDTANWLRSMAVKEDRLYLTELNVGGTFRIADVGDADAPSLIGGHGPIDLYGLAFRNDYVFSIGNNTGVTVLDVSTPAVPALYGAGYAQHGYTISVAASRAYANSDFVGGGVKVLDAEDPAALSLAGELAPAGGASDPLVMGNSLYTFYDALELHRNEREPLVAARYVTASTGAILSYDVSWLDAAEGDDHAARCWVTGGSCSVGAPDQGGDAVVVEWTLPAAAGDHEIMVAVGNGHYFGTTKDRVRVQ